MPKIRFALSSAMLLLALTSCNSPTRPATVVDLAGEEAKLKEKEVAWSNAIAAKDVEKMVAHYTDDGVLIEPGVPALKGKEAMRRSLKEMFADPNMRLEFKTEKIEIAKSGDMAYSRGSYTMTTSDPKTKKPVNDKGSYVTVYKKIGADWMAVADINTSEVH